MTQPLKYLSEAKLAELRASIPSNLARYSWDDFQDLSGDNGWSIEASEVRVDLDCLGRLGEELGAAECDADASIIVYKALQGMTPAMAREERVWARLTHVECLEYSRERWVTGVPDDRLSQAIRDHMFAQGITGVRDDNAISRLWWNMHIATMADPHDPVGALRLILKRADIRMQFVERVGTASRRPIAQAVLRAMRRHDWLTAADRPFRRFMKALNREGGGVLFEALDATDADALMERCAAAVDDGNEPGDLGSTGG